MFSAPREWFAAFAVAVHRWLTLCRRRKSLDVLLEASIDRLFDEHVSKATKAVDDDTKQLIKDAIGSTFARVTVTAAIKIGLNNEPDVLLGLEAKFMRHFKNALADAVARLVAERNRCNLLDQLKEI